jgi:type IV pilus assembly protein PilW
LGAAVTKSPDLASNVNKGLMGSQNIYVVENRFYITNTNGVPELYCIGNGGTAIGANLKNPGQPIAENVEQMRVTYGVASGTKNATTGIAYPQAVDRYLSAANVGTNWAKVVSVRICLVVRSANDNVALAPQTYTDCSNTSVLATDRRLRSVFSTTIAIRSRTVGAS